MEVSYDRSGRKKIKIKLADGKERTIQSMMATTLWSPDGKPISANQMIEKLFGELPRFFKDEDELRQALEQAGHAQGACCKALPKRASATSSLPRSAA